MANYPKVAQFKTAEQFRSRLAELQLDLPMDDDVLAGSSSPLSADICIDDLKIGNRWCIHPMEGWDAGRDGAPSAHTLRRWHNFGISGAKLIWGGEAAAVQPDGRANPHQTLAIPENEKGLAQLLNSLRTAHIDRFGNTDGLIVGLQLTHSGRFCRPNSKKLEPRIAYHHPLLDRKFGIDANDDSVVWKDDDLERLIASYVQAARIAARIGFQFVDVKACHGYLLHEFLSARCRPGKFGGDLEGRSRLLRTIVERIHSEVNGIRVGVRLSVFDTLPYESNHGSGQPMPTSLPYEFGFGVDPLDPTQIDLTEPLELLQMLSSIGVRLFNISCGSPYYNPHIQRPAIFPPSDGYQPPEDPLVGVARQIEATRRCKSELPHALVVGTGYSYLQDFLPHVAQAVVRQKWADSIGLGRMVLSYPDLPAATLLGEPLQRKRICRTFSDCTTAPRNGLVSGCYPLDPYYKSLPEAERLRKIKRPS